MGKITSISYKFLITLSRTQVITSLYADAKGKNIPIAGLILNSPFFDFNENGWNENVAIPVASFLSSIAKDTELSGESSTAYGESLHKNYHGEWLFDLKKKKLASGPKRLCWISAIHAGHKQVQNGLQIACPVLSMSSDKSISGEKWNAGYQTADGVLDVKDIQLYSRHIGKQTTIRIIPGGMHDLILSKPNVRNAVYREMISWLNRIR